MNLPKNITLLEIVPDYTGVYRVIKFTGDITTSKLFGFRKTVKTHTYVAFGMCGSWILVNIDGTPVKVPVHQNSYIAPILDSEVLLMEYKKTFKVDHIDLGTHDTLDVLGGGR